MYSSSSTSSPSPRDNAFASPADPHAATNASTLKSSTTSTNSAAAGTSMLSHHVTPLQAFHGDLEKTANECIVAAYDLVWHQSEYNQALLLLHKALDIQRSYLGKHHKDVGYTCNFIATTYWLQDQEWNNAMRYFLEARRIFCKNMDGDIALCSPLVRGIDDRIHCLLLRFQLSAEDIERAKQAIERSMAHELQGDKFKAQGLVQAARDEYKRARKVAGVLRQLI